MIHGFLLVFGVFWVCVGIVMCVMLVLVSRKARAAMLLVTIPAVVIVAILSVDFACRLLHLPRSVMPHQKQIISGINEALWLAAIRFRWCGFGNGGPNGGQGRRRRSRRHSLLALRYAI